MDISVIVPCYNSEKTLDKCLESLLSQTLQVKIFIINDGSEDRTLAIAQKYELQYKNITVFSHNNRGLPQTRKAGLSHVTTKYTAFVDSDDWVEPDMMEVLFNLSEHYDAEISVCGATTSGHEPSKHITGPICMSGSEALRIIHQRSGIGPFMCNKLFLTDCLRKFTFPEENLIGEDYTTLLSYIEDVERIVWIQKPLYHYIQYFGSMSHTGYGVLQRKSYENYRRIYENACNLKNEAYLCDMAEYMCVELLGLYIAMIRNNCWDTEASEYMAAFFKAHLTSFMKSKQSPVYRIAVWMIVYMPGFFRILYKLYMLTFYRMYYLK